MGRKTLFLHIGHYKTGTTYFQHLIHKNRAFLKEQGLWIPRKGMSPVGAHNYLAHRELALSFEKSGRALFRSVIDEALVRDDVTNVLISYEGWSKPTRLRTSVKDFFTSIQADIDIKIILVVRPHMNFTISMFRELVQNVGYVGRYVDFLDNMDNPRDPWRDIAYYHKIIDLWSDIVLRENVTVLNYRQISNNLSAELLAIAGIVGPLPRDDVEYRNPTLHATAIEFCRRLNRIDPQFTRQVQTTLGEIRSNGLDFQKVAEISYSEAKEIHTNKFADDRSKLRNMGLDFVEEWEDFSDWKWSDEEDFSEATEKGLEILREMIDLPTFDGRRDLIEPLVSRSEYFKRLTLGSLRKLRSRWR